MMIILRVYYYKYSLPGFCFQLRAIAASGRLFEERVWLAQGLGETLHYRQKYTRMNFSPAVH